MSATGEDETDANPVETEDDWTSILNEVSRLSSNNKSTKYLVVLGDDGAGKTTLVQKLRHVEDDYREIGNGIEFNYVCVQDDESDDSAARMNVWILDGDPTHQPLLRYALNETTIEHAIVLLVVNLSKPWSVMESLERWSGVLRRHVDSLKLPPKLMKDLEEKIVRDFQGYADPEGGKGAGSGAPVSSAATAESSSGGGGGTEEENVVLPLGENVLTNNLGIPIVVVCSKCDGMGEIEKENDYKDEHFDFIQQHIRKFCLSYGAALAYVSSKVGKNCRLLYQYIVHKLYNFPFKTPASIVERDAIFIPAGWDNEKKTSILYEHMKRINPADPYEDHISKPVVKRRPHEQEISAEEDQFFLMRLQTVAPLAGSERRQTTSSVPEKSPRMERSGAPAPAPAAVPTSKRPKDGQSRAGETMLADFFNSLLTKKGAAASGKGAAAAEKDPTATLQALAGADKKKSLRLSPAPTSSTANNT